jgi:hypothetical protein
MTFKKAIGKYDKYTNRVISILKKKCPDIEFNPNIITSGFVLGFSPSIVASGLIKAHEARQK